MRPPHATNLISPSNNVLYYSHNSAKQPAPYFNPAYVRSLELAATTDATSHNPPDSDDRAHAFQPDAAHRSDLIARM
ncbi:hypothetical protein CCGE532_30565 (plasmid) [Rhizobium sp. CCGE532]|nr:hypothetical protein CCGE532_30565 [Rhizobium sp. CCGE532]